MKTLSIYLLSIVMLFVSCQKDTDDGTTIEKSKKDCKCNHKRYLPIEVEIQVVNLNIPPYTTKYSFSYINDAGDLSTVHQGADGEYFEYENGLLKKITTYRDSYKEYNYISENEVWSPHTSITCYDDPSWPVDDPHTICDYDVYFTEKFKFANKKLITYLGRQFNINYSYEDNRLSKMSRESTTANYRDAWKFSYDTTKKYWAKNVKNKELLQSIFFPVKESITSIQTIKGAFVVGRKDFTYVYNEDGYPTEISIKTSDENSNVIVTEKWKIYYKIIE